jgi:hypothetical protein
MVGFTVTGSRSGSHNIMHNEQMTYCGNVGVMNNLKESTVSMNIIALVPNTEAFPNEKQCHCYRRENIVMVVLGTISCH